MAATTLTEIRTDSTSDQKAASATRRRVLIVDDDSSVLGLLSTVLENLDVDVETCSDPEAAIARFQESAFDLVISDERMPKMTGTEMLRRVRSMSPRTPTIILTAYVTNKALSAAYEQSGVFGYVAKPFDNRTFVGTVREALRCAQNLS